MRDKNTMSKADYVFDMIVWMFWITWSYKNLIFEKIPGFSLETSKYVLIFLCLFHFVTGMMLHYKKRRTLVTLLINTIFPIGMYAAIVRICEGVFWGKILLGVILILMVLYSGMVLSGRLDGTYKKDDLMKKRVRYWITGARNILGAGMMLFLLIPAVFAATDNVFAKEETVQAAQLKEYKIADHMEEILNLMPEKWYQLGEEEKKELAQLVVNIECTYLGLPYRLTLETEELEDGKKAYYDNLDKKIVIDGKHLYQGELTEVLKTLLHESYHCYQRCLVEACSEMDEKYKNLISLRDAKDYEIEFANYIDGTDDFEGYYTQWLEVDARKYAEEGYRDYFERITIYLETGNKEG